MTLIWGRADHRVAPGAYPVLARVGAGARATIVTGRAIGHDRALPVLSTGAALPAGVADRCRIGHALAGGRVAGLADGAAAAGTRPTVNGGAAIVTDRRALPGAGLGS